MARRVLSLVGGLLGGLLICLCSACGDGTDTTEGDDMGRDVARGDPGVEEPPTNDVVADDGGSDFVGDDVEPDGSDAADTAEPGGADDGEPCEADEDCRGGNCLGEEEGFPGGLCSPNICGIGVICTGTGSGCYDGGGVVDPYCTRRCETSQACRDGYRCERDGVGAGFCEVIDTGADRPDGANCDADDDCLSGTCLQPPEYPGGQCTTIDCNTDDDCAGREGSAVCVPDIATGVAFCRRRCFDDDGCRPRYACVDVASGVSVCGPEPDITLEIDTEGSPLGFVCDHPSSDDDGRIWSVGFEVPEGATSAHVVALTEDGQQLAVNRLVSNATGLTIRFEDGGDNERQADTACVGGFACALAIPWTEALNAQLVHGTWAMSVKGESPRVCSYVLTEDTPGDTIDLNVVLVNVDGLHAAEAPEDPDMIEVLDDVNAIFEQAGLSIGDVRFYDPDLTTRFQYEVIRTPTDLERLPQTVVPDGETVDELLAVNVFLVESITVSGVIGISGGLPGPAGLHGAPFSGIVATRETMGQGEDGNRFLASILAHEIGHFMGLLHTSEILFHLQDPLDDTPFCDIETRLRRGQGILGCPDIDNLMFPVASSTTGTLTTGQAFVLGASPLSKD